ncbi:hypothetical protein GCM10017083_22740 [Thalassobaculum fulvum]|uniref:Uncharacterized protein n=1 Tax=Thalassobaculum fulvum TaxID=1633335 RepID=A0A918XSL3_9PROT|nr:hypothetical protein GCM10017083_22740 [Thalassobaculum fulvum]
MVVRTDRLRLLWLERGFLRLDLVEPLCQMLKDEVHALGCELGLSVWLVGRRPFAPKGL